MAWQSLVEQGIFLTGKSSNPAGSFIYLISGAHIVHTLAGLIVLAYTYYQSNQKKYHSKNLLGLQLCSIYWHFLDLLWIYLLIFLILYH
jgi:cytochrome c oxidase subunit 3